MADTLFYYVIQGHADNSQWQMGMYVTSPNPSVFNAKNSLQAWAYAFFNVGTIHAYGYHTYMSPAAGEDVFLTYQVDQLTDRKVLVDRAEFPGVGTSGLNWMPVYEAPVLYMRPTVILPHQVARMYLPPITRDGLFHGAVDPTAQQEFVDFASDAFAELASGDLHPVVRNRTHHTHVLASSFQVSSAFAALTSRADPTKPTLISAPL